MATTTTNFGWDIPQSTDLVKDGATAIAALGQDIDTAFIDLKGGTTGQVLAKASNTDLDYSWVAQDDSNAIQNAIVDAKGDLISATAADTPARLAVGSNDQVLTADSTTATGLKWATPANAGSMTLLSTTTLSGTSTTVSSISQSYTNLFIWIVDLTFSAAAYPKISAGGAAGAFSGTTAGAAFSSDNFWTNYSSTSHKSTNILIPNYTSASYLKILKAFGASLNNNYSFDSAGRFESKTSAVDAITIGSVAGTATIGGTMFIYGVK